MGKLGERVEKENKFVSVLPGKSIVVRIPAGEDYWVAKVNSFGGQVYQLTVLVGDDKKLLDVNPYVAGQIDVFKEENKQEETTIKISRTEKDTAGNTKYSVSTDIEIPF